MALALCAGGGKVLSVRAALQRRRLGILLLLDGRQRVEAVAVGKLGAAFAADAEPGGGRGGANHRDLNGWRDSVSDADESRARGRMVYRYPTLQHTPYRWVQY